MPVKLWQFNGSSNSIHHTHSHIVYMCVRACECLCYLDIIVLSWFYFWSQSIFTILNITMISRDKAGRVPRIFTIFTDYSFNNSAFFYVYFTVTFIWLCCVPCLPAYVCVFFFCYFLYLIATIFWFACFAFSTDFGRLQIHVCTT